MDSSCLDLCLTLLPRLLHCGKRGDRKTEKGQVKVDRGIGKQEEHNNNDNNNNNYYY